MFGYFSKLALSLLVCAALVSGCANKRNTGPTQNAPRYFTHRVSAQGETLGMVAKWYTGSSNNWQAILESNPGLDPRKIRIGTDILIPDTMVIKRTPMPKKMVATTKPEELGVTPPVDGSVPPTEGIAAIQPDSNPGSTSFGEIQNGAADQFPPDNNNFGSMENSDTNEIIQQGQFAAQDETPPSKGKGSKLSNWLTGNIDKDSADAQPPAEEPSAAFNPPSNTEANSLQVDGEKLRQDAEALSKQAQEQGQVTDAQVKAIQDQAQALQQKALEAQAQALKDASTAIEQSNTAQQKSREELLKELTEDY